MFVSFSLGLRLVRIYMHHCIQVFKEKTVFYDQVTSQQHVLKSMGLSQSWSYLEKVCRQREVVNSTPTRLCSYRVPHTQDLWAKGGYGCAGLGSPNHQKRRSGIPKRTHRAKCWWSTCGASLSSSGWRSN